MTPREAETWDRELDRRAAQLEEMRVARAEAPDLIVKMRQNRRFVRGFVRPLTRAWAERAREARVLPPPARALQRELRRAHWSRPDRHWAGLVMRARVAGLRLLAFLLAFARVFAVVGVVVFIVVLAIVLWRTLVAK